MKSKTLGLTVLCLAVAALPLHGASAAARKSDKIATLSLQDLIHHPDYAVHVPSDIKFYFADQPVTVKQMLGPVRTSRKTTLKTDPFASCRWAMYSALIAIAEEARVQGGNAVVNIRSNFGDVETASQQSYKCGIGMRMVGVALKGDVAVVE
ncbi:hypothetical protein [Caulobacter sp. NIBR1757]|uniref:hypothetical protein n=1 Tax=Caulobacter sp. NIBR1757 TaxID=3016000 RepID=UPI0022F06EE9|nr:hypothetical protein [Caulobacter sp. NIBR1757]WGM40539.1 hypothetical protein AMEJIAPC_03484 [Caulobacter sp. NIBR1757]